MYEKYQKYIDNLFKNYNSKNLKEALVDANKLAKFKIKDKEINLVCGEVFLFFKLYKKALFSLAYSIKLDPNFYIAYKLLAIAEYSLGNFNKAIKIFEVAKKLNSRDSDLFFNIAKCYDDLGKYELSIFNYIKSLELDSNNINSQSNLIKSLTFFKPKVNLDNEIIKLDMSLHKLNLPFSLDKVLDDNTLKIFLNNL